MPARRSPTRSKRFDKANRKFEDTTRYMAGTPINLNDRDIETHIGGISDEEVTRGAAAHHFDTEEPLETTGKTRKKSHRSKRAKKS